MFNARTATVAQLQAEITRLKALGGGTMHLRMELQSRSGAHVTPVQHTPAAVRKDCRRMARELLRK